MSRLQRFMRFMDDIADIIEIWIYPKKWIMYSLLFILATEVLFMIVFTVWFILR